ncbi:MAG: exonuclease domain-containing protein [Bacteroidota bacterium]|jgi:DNA polymerase-3 subunit epsilon|nr:GIY-YIG nuclease family protein [Ignavibacteria bacterium]MCU7500466.1 GIY-YIG nuclease family protein [Ignavibacteria bacterium]MCU7511859.1 GIY-YIG nuclease family protein [Ignavibacteria bacterium]MCU7519940.1 GIY-YIG nuclease family protein [Ignavibacteria bacterium]MCU7523015.1 GIY-YIG nuclease family protein [Ignavibacteria bacterium]
MSPKNLTDIPFENAEFCVVDVETTGMSPSTCRIIEVGMVRIRKLKIVETYQTFVNPGMEIPYFITTLTGISNSDVYDAPYFDEIANRVKEFMDDSILIGHNLQFDVSFLRRAFEDCGSEKFANPLLCTLKLARKMYPELSSKSLSSVIKHLKIRNKNVHRALSDATATGKVLLKMIKELKAKEGYKTAAEIIDFQSSPFKEPDYMLTKKKLASDVARLPDLPGVYFFKNSKEEIIYVGKAKSLKTRVKHYFSSTAPSKSRKIVRQAERLGFMTTNSELTALIAESELIKIHNPVHNVLLKKFGNNFFLKVLRQDEYPKVEMARRFDFDGDDYFGPYTNKDSVKNMVKLVHSTFQLRECSDREFNKHRGCYLTQIYRCVAPCMKDFDPAEYEKELDKVYEFLSGKNQYALDSLIAKMKYFSEKQRFEEASETRDLINLVLAQIHKTSILSEPVNSTKVLIEVRTTGKKDFVLLLSGRIYIKDYIVGDDDHFDEALDDYFDNTINYHMEADRRDLDKIKIALNWLIRNRNNVRVFYLKDFQSKHELFKHIQSGLTGKIKRPSKGYQLKDFMQ